MNVQQIVAFHFNDSLYTRISEKTTCRCYTMLRLHLNIYLLVMWTNPYMWTNYYYDYYYVLCITVSATELIILYGPWGLQLVQMLFLLSTPLGQSTERFFFSLSFPIFLFLLNFLVFIKTWQLWLEFFFKIIWYVSSRKWETIKTIVETPSWLEEMK